MVIGRRSLLLAGAAVSAAAAGTGPSGSARAQCVTDTPAVDACRGGVRVTVPYGATLDLAFGSPALDPRITFTRTSTATYFDSSGTLQTAAINAPRFDYDPATHVVRGLLIEEPRTNTCLQSADFTNAAWVPAGVGGPIAPVVTANQVTAPDGTLTADRIVLPTVNAGTSIVYQIPGTATANIYAFSVYLRGSVGGEQLYLLTTADTTVYYRAPVTLTTAWQRFTLVTSALTAAGWLFAIGVDLRDVSQAGKNGSTVYAWGAQVELGPFATSHIPTTTVAVTRAVDVVTMPTAAWFTSSAGTIQVEFSTANVAAAGTQSGIIRLDDTTSNNAALIYAALPTGLITSLSVIATVTQLNAQPGTTTNGTPQKSAIAYGGGLWRWATGGAVGNGTGSATPLPATRLILGADNVDPTTWKLNGYLRAVRYWPRALSNAELQSVTR